MPARSFPVRLSQRPRILVVALALALIITLLPVAAASADAAEGARPLDLTNSPDDNVRALRKLQCHLTDGKPAIYTWNGSAYSRVAGERDRLLFDYEGYNIRACVTLDDPDGTRGYGYKMVSKEILLYLDPATGEVMRTWTNPWTDQTHDVIHVANDPVNMRGLYARSSRGDFRLGATIHEGKGWFSFQVPLFYENPLGGPYQPYVGGTYHAMEMFSFFFDADELVDPTTDGLDDTFVGWARMSRWLPWMQMGDRAGWMIFSGAGKRVRTWDELPKVLRDEVARAYPGFDAPPPLDDERPNETSWTYLKKRIDAERAAEPDGADAAGH